MRNFVVTVTGAPRSGPVWTPVVHKLRASTIRKAVDQVLAHIRDSGEHQRLEPHLSLGYVNVRVCLTRLDTGGLPGEELTGGYVKNAGGRNRKKRVVEDIKPLSARERILERMAKLHDSSQ